MAIDTSLYDVHHASEAPTSLHHSGIHHARLLEMFRFSARHLPHGRVWLDIGCASGAFLSLLHQGRTGPCIGVDLSPVALQLARQRNPDLSLARVSSTSLAVADGRCQVVSMLEMLGHLPSEIRPQAVAEAARVLEPGGWLLVAIRLGDNPNLVNEEELSHLLHAAFMRVDRLAYDYSFSRRLIGILNPQLGKIIYYINILNIFRHRIPDERHTWAWRTLGFLAHHFPLLLELGELFLRQLLWIWQKPLTSPWVGQILWQLGLRRAKHHPTGVAYVCRKRGDRPCSCIAG